MNCFSIFKGKSKQKPEVNLAPEIPALHRPSSSLPPPKSISTLYKENEHKLRIFSFKELKDATNGFNGMLEIGEGGFGKVFKGTIRNFPEKDDRTVVAIKKLNPHSWQGHKEWRTEIQFLSVVSHVNLVKLLGYCSTDGDGPIQRLLVYEFMCNKSLDDHLFNRALPVLPWQTRLEIILGAAQGLSYLHSGLEVQVIYRDFKSSNILLDVDFAPKLSDFGLAREGPQGDDTHVSTNVVGTYGYAAPEYMLTGHLKVQSDLWSFGVVLYEILTGRRALDKDRPAAEEKLVDWVKQFPINSNKFNMMMDPRLGGQYPLAAARTVAKIADKCLNKSPVDRPPMAEVVECLKQALGETESCHSSRRPVLLRSESL